MKQKAKIHDLDMLPVYLELSEGQFRSSFEELQNLEACQDRPYVLDDNIIQRIIKLHVEQKEYNKLTLEQCRQWRKQNPSPNQIEDIEIVEGFTKKLQEVNAKILHLANKYKQQTIGRLLEKDPIESALDFLMGKIPLPTTHGPSDSITPFGPGSTHDLLLFQQPDDQKIQQLYKIKSAGLCVVPDSLEIMYQDYVHQRSLLNHYYDECFQECLEKMEVIAKELGNYEPVFEKAVIQNDSEMNIFLDYASLYRSRNGNRFALDWLNKNQQQITPENEKVVRGYAYSRFAVLRLDKKLPSYAIQCTDILSQQSYLLIDRGLHASDKIGCFFICSFIDMGNYIMTTGGGIPVDGRSPGGKAILTLVVRSLDHFRKTTSSFTKEICKSVSSIYGFCLRNGTLTHMTINKSF